MLHIIGLGSQYLHSSSSLSSYSSEIDKTIEDILIKCNILLTKTYKTLTWDYFQDIGPHESY